MVFTSAVRWDGFTLEMSVLLELALGLVMTWMIYNASISLWRGWQVDYGILPSNCMLLLLGVGPFLGYCVGRAAWVPLN